MSSNTDPDRQLRQFLQEYHPPVPTASPSLESQLFQQIDAPSSGPLFAVQPEKINPSWRRFSAGLALVAMAIAGGITWRWQTQTALTPPSPEILEAFLAESWTGAIAVSEEAAWVDVDVQPEQISPSQEWWQLTQSTAATVDNP